MSHEHVEDAATERERVMHENAISAIDALDARIDQLTGDLLAMYSREEKLLRGIGKREARITDLRDELTSQRKLADDAVAQAARATEERDAMEERLERLLNTKAMRVQRAYWRLRDRARRSTAE